MLTLVVVEIVLRFTAPQYHNFVQPDDTIGYSLVPGSHYMFFLSSGELSGLAFFRHDQHSRTARPRVSIP
jgi:hypothetical protein